MDFHFTMPDYSITLPNSEAMEITQCSTLHIPYRFSGVSISSRNIDYSNRANQFSFFIKPSPNGLLLGK
jgi:hypothetical protein